MKKVSDEIRKILDMNPGDFGPGEIHDLRKIIDYLARQYYVHDDPIVSDSRYDELYRRLEKLEDEHPLLRNTNSPTQRVGGTPLKEFDQVRHEFPMLSLSNATEIEELREFDARIKKAAGIDDIGPYVIEPKIDGLAVSLTYDNGGLIIGATRGDGSVGEDVTLNVRTIKTVPLEIDAPGNTVVQGEVYLPLKAFGELNKRRENAGEKLFANPRNAAAGSIRQLDPKIAAGRPLAMFAHSLRNSADKGISSQKEALDWLGKHDFLVNPEIQTAGTIEDVISITKSWAGLRDKLDYEVDGLVIKLDDLALAGRLGSTAKAPRAAIAFKFQPREKETTVLNIEASVGRTGTITPVATFEPVLLDGSMVSHASLYNMDEIHRKDIRIGDRVIIAKGGDVIPKVIKVVTEARTGKEKEFKMPEKCPFCESHVVKKEGEVDYRCSSSGCFAVVHRKIEHFVSRNAMDIEGLGTKIVEKFLIEGIIHDIGDLYSLNLDEISSMEGFGEKSAENLIKEIEESKEKPLHRLLAAISIPGVGSEAAKLLADHLLSFDKIAAASTDELVEIPGIGPKMAESIVAFFNDEHELRIIQKLRDAGLKGFEAVEKKVSTESGEFSGKVFVITGTVEGYSRDILKERIEELGGKVSGSLSGKTDYLIMGENPGSKYDKALKLGTTIIEGDEIYKVLSLGKT